MIFITGSLPKSYLLKGFIFFMLQLFSKSIQRNVNLLLNGDFLKQEISQYGGKRNDRA